MVVGRVTFTAVQGSSRVGAVINAIAYMCRVRPGRREGRMAVITSGNFIGVPDSTLHRVPHPILVTVGGQAAAERGAVRGRRVAGVSRAREGREIHRALEMALSTSVVHVAVVTTDGNTMVDGTEENVVLVATRRGTTGSVLVTHGTACVGITPHARTGVGTARWVVAHVRARIRTVVPLSRRTRDPRCRKDVGLILQGLGHTSDHSSIRRAALRDVTGIGRNLVTVTARDRKANRRIEVTVVGGRGDLLTVSRSHVVHAVRNNLVIVTRVTVKGRVVPRTV